MSTTDERLMTMEKKTRIALATENDCFLECPNQTYGLECKKICGNCKNKESCHHVDGSCLNGCDKGVYGEKCDIGTCI